MITVKIGIDQICVKCKKVMKAWESTRDFHLIDIEKIDRTDLFVKFKSQTILEEAFGAAFENPQILVVDTCNDCWYAGAAANG